MRDGGESLAREQTTASLLESIAREALCRLARSRDTGGFELDDRTLSDLIDTARASGPQATVDFAANLVRTGIRPEDIVDHYIPAAARHLGRMWETDSMTFADVTIGASGLQSALRTLSAPWHADAAGTQATSSVLLVVPQAEQHTLGAMVTASWLRRRGISVALRISPSAVEISNLLSLQQFDAVFLSVGCREKIAPCISLAHSIRTLTRRKIPIAIGGSAIKEGDAATFGDAVDVMTCDPAFALRSLGLENCRVNPG